jgi:transcriptional repressor NrdR
MRCPFCGNIDTQVKDSRPAEDHVSIRRRRFCPACGGRFTTYERVQLRDLVVIKIQRQARGFRPRQAGTLDPHRDAETPDRPRTHRPDDLGIVRRLEAWAKPTSRPSRSARS